MAFEDFIPRTLELLDNWAFRLLFILIILVITSVVARVFDYFVKKYFLRSSHHLNVDKTRFSILSKLITVTIYIIGISIAGSTIPSLRTTSLSLLTGAGVLAAILGFASQQAVSNVVSGIFIAMFKPFRVGDRIMVQDELGDVEDITLRHTVIKNLENKRIIIPNSVIGNESITNYSIGDPKIRQFMDFSISYDSDIGKAMKIMQDEAKRHHLWIDTRSEDEKKEKPAVDVRVMKLGDFSVDLRAFVWAPDARSAFLMSTDLNRSIKERFDKEGVEIPFPYRTVVYKKDMKRKRR